MDKIWLKSYPPGVPAEIDCSDCASLNDLLAVASRKYLDRPAFKNMGGAITYAGLDRLSRDFAAWLQSLGLEKGSRVALMMPNLLQYPIALFGVLRAGMVVVNVNPLYTSRELQHQLQDSGAEVIVILENFAHVLEEALPRTSIKQVVTTQAGDMLGAPRRWMVNFVVKRVRKMVPAWGIPGAIGMRTALARGAGANLREAAPGHDDVALLQYTGGTTGASKGAVLTHGNLIANVLQARTWIGGALEDGRERVITALPLYHIFSLTTNCLLFLKMGGLNFLITNPKDLRGLVKELKRSRFTVMTGVNTLFNALLNTPGFDELDFKNLKFALGGGAAIQRTVAERWQAVTGRPLVEGYGLTEASPTVACNLFNIAHSGTIGLPVPSTEVSIRDDDNRELPPGIQGEICVRGPQVMRGYWNRPEETAGVFTADGWLRTGDIGQMDERGYIQVTDRKKDMILVSGFNVYPTEVEGIIAAVPGVTECAVVGLPDPVTGEAVKVFVVANNPNLTPDAIIGHCLRNLTKYKIPKSIEFRADLPKSPIGKVLRRELRAAAIETGRNRTAAAGATAGNPDRPVGSSSSH